DADNNGIPDTVDTQISDATRLVEEAEAKHKAAEAKLADVKADGSVTQADVDAVTEANRQLEAAKQKAQEAVDQLPETPAKAKDAKTALNDRLTPLTAVEVPAVDDADNNGIPDTVDTQISDATRLVEEAEAKHKAAEAKL
ncbi:GA-like domain-containing protein, partial [Streptococcus pluranimalium]|uniref:GA-like domain-containing protein n=1 Tax=Streptococcus pluranimalium TaxID=82348 RepID=UPI0039E73A22